MKWFNSFPTEISDQVQALLNDGAVYINGRDKAHRIVCIYNVSIIKDYSYEKIEIMQDAIMHLL
jgi:hypothetical protein